MATLLLCTGCGPQRLAPAKLIIAAAADLQFAMEDVSRQFHAAYPQVQTQIVYGSSGNFYAQIRNGAPFDIFLSADLEYPRQLTQQGLAFPQSLFTYAVGRLAVWAPAQSPLDVARLQMKVFEDPAVKHVALANPAHAPYGKAAEAALRHFGVYDAVAGKIVLAENIAQTLQFVQSGAAEAGIVALSLAVAPPVRPQGRYWEVPLDAYPRMWQGGVILKRAQSSSAAAAFRTYLTSTAGRQILQQYGFSLPAN
ncbi:MAG: molybdate ABC transporter substrate-binding protein [Candidatus Sulfopaludibacter sp.]|nr:molybdate ABC transporter substrate-binding protein [Candidatus Sulfopaludibacter sp.]